MYTKLILIFILIFILINKTQFREGFVSKKTKQKSLEIYNNKSAFRPGAKYTDIKRSHPWVDPVIYDDIYNLALNNSLTISNLEKTLNNNIT